MFERERKDEAVMAHSSLLVNMIFPKQMKMLIKFQL
jgi:hypothetical protein